MTGRIAWSGIVLALVLAGCATPKQASDVDDLLFVSTRDGVAAVDGESGRTVVNAGYAAHNSDWSRLFLAEDEAGATDVVLRDLATNARRTIARIAGTFTPRIVSRSGELLALAEPHTLGTPAWNPVSRRRTGLAVTGVPGQVRRFDLPGNFEPEAFTADDRTLVLVEYVPAIRPERYRLRELDLASGSVSPLGVRLKLLAPPEMAGTGRTQVPAPDASALYTLYTRQGPNLSHVAPGTVVTPAPVHSFVHVLNLVQGFAHCVDLPDGFGAGPAAIAVAPEGDRLFAIDAGRVLVVDTRSLRVSRSARIRLRPTFAISAVAKGGTDGELFVGAGADVVVLDQTTLRVSRRYVIGRDVTGLALSSDSRLLYVALEDGIAVIDAETGAESRRLHVPGLTGISAAHPAARSSR